HPPAATGALSAPTPRPSTHLDLPQDQLSDRPYDARRAGGERHTSALQNLFNKLLGRLHHCPQNRTLHDPERAFAQAVALTA
ncbi:hypothetical protein ACFU6L_37300, partial [Kitasatospora sp. NPDC057541]